MAVNKLARIRAQRHKIWKLFSFLKLDSHTMWRHRMNAKQTRQRSRLMFVTLLEATVNEIGIIVILAPVPIVFTQFLVPILNKNVQIKIDKYVNEQNHSTSPFAHSSLFQRQINNCFNFFFACKIMCTFYSSKNVCLYNWAFDAFQIKVQVQVLLNESDM